IPDVLNMLKPMYHMNIRNVPEEEGYSVEKVTDNHYIVYHNSPNVDAGLYGFLWGIFARFKQPHEMFVVRQLDPNPKPEICRSAFEVKWGTSKEDVR
ncbi:MAG: hypothetical protein CUN56_02795, partial [Phototrophicales bacterium]